MRLIFFFNDKVGILLTNNTAIIIVKYGVIFTKLNSISKDLRIKAEQTIIASELDWTILRPTMIFGTPADRNIIRLIKWIRKYPIIPIFGNGNSLQMPVYVNDLAWSIVKVSEIPKTFLTVTTTSLKKFFSL